MMPFLLMKRAGIALGSNMGDKNSLMVQARDHLLKMSLSDDPFLQSSLYATSPQGCPHGADDYLNAVVEFTWPGTVEELLVHCQGIERARDASAPESAANPVRRTWTSFTRGTWWSTIRPA